MSKKKIYKTIITVEVFSDEPIDEISLADVVYEITDGEWVGNVTYAYKNIELTGDKAVKEIKGVGSDPDFFGMDDLGNEINY